MGLVGDPIFCVILYITTFIKYATKKLDIRHSVDAPGRMRECG